MSRGNERRRKKKEESLTSKKRKNSKIRSAAKKIASWRPVKNLPGRNKRRESVKKKSRRGKRKDWLR